MGRQEHGFSMESFILKPMLITEQLTHQAAYCIQSLLEDPSGMVFENRTESNNHQRHPTASTATASSIQLPTAEANGRTLLDVCPFWFCSERGDGERETASRMVSTVTVGISVAAPRCKLRYCPIPLHISPIPPLDSRAFPRVRPDMNPLVAVGPDGQVRMNQDALKRAKARACAGRGRCNSVTGGRVWIC